MIVVVRSYWQDYTSPKIKSMGEFFNFIIEMKIIFLAKSIDRRPRGWGFCGSSIAGNWSRYNLCDIVTKASVAFVVSTDPDVHFKCSMRADSKVQASIKHETKGKPIQACRVHSGALRTHLSAINRQVFVVVVFQTRAHSPHHVPSSHLASTSTGFSCHKNGKWRLTTIIFS